MATTDVEVIDYDEVPDLPSGLKVLPTWRFLVRDVDSGEVYEATALQVKTYLVPTVVVANPSVTLQPVAGVVVNQPTTLVAIATAVAPATVAAVEFFNGNSKIGQATSSPFTIEWTPNYGSIGNRVLFARVTDSLGNQTTSEGVAVTVAAPSAPANSAPTVTMNISPAKGTIGEPLAIEAIATDSDGTITRIELYNYGILLDSATTSPYTFSYVPLTNAQLFLSIKAYDNLNTPTQTPGKSVNVVSGNSVPGAPTGAVAIAGNNVVTVNWVAPANTGNTPITGYQVFRNDDLTPVATVTGTTYTDIFAYNGEEYVYAIKAVNIVGPSVPSDPTEPVTPSAGAPPSFNTTYNPGDNISTVTWNASTGTLLKLNLPLSTNSDPNPATMTVYAPNGIDQVGQADFSGFDSGAACAIVYNGVTYYKVLANGDVTLS